MPCTFHFSENVSIQLPVEEENQLCLLVDHATAIATLMHQLTYSCNNELFLEPAFYLDRSFSAARPRNLCLSSDPCAPHQFPAKSKLYYYYTFLPG